MCERLFNIREKKLNLNISEFREVQMSVHIVHVIQGNCVWRNALASGRFFHQKCSILTKELEKSSAGGNESIAI